MRRRIRATSSTIVKATKSSAVRLELGNLWLLRATLRTSVGRRWLSNADRIPDSVMRVLGLNRFFIDGVLNTHAAMSSLKNALERLEKKEIRPDEAVLANIEMLATALKMTEAEKQVLYFAVKMHADEPLNEFFQHLGSFTLVRLCDLIAKVLNENPGKIRQALASDGSLISTGLLKLNLGKYWRELPIELMGGLEAVIHNRYRRPDEIMANFFRPSNAPSLGITDFPHLVKELKLLQCFLRETAESKTSGANVLLYGPPGTGKTELARLLATRLDLTMYEVNYQEENGDAQDNKGRFSAYLLAQKFLKEKRPALILFDEIEDVFPDQPMPFFFTKRPSGAAKAWTNRLLEQNPVPTIWISNRIGQIDSAFLRRFDFVLEIKRPPKSVRQGILNHYLKGVRISEESIKQLSENESLAPSDMEKLARVLKLSTKDDREHVEEAVRLLAEQRLKAYGERMAMPSACKNSLQYDMAFLNTDMPLDELTEALELSPKGTMCLYGPPGTGKTAFAYYLAEQVDKRLLAKRASDLLSPWVGMTESNIAEMFREAREENALLLLDEADSFFQDRKNAMRQWEVTQVNEMLVQMENFDGLFICSTNLMDNLDAASLRRFTFKVHFDFMTKNQRREMFCRTMESLGRMDKLRKRSDAIYQKLDILTNLTPGDFALFLRQRQVIKRVCEPEELLTVLERESRAKGMPRRSTIGFM